MGIILTICLIAILIFVPIIIANIRAKYLGAEIPISYSVGMVMKKTVREELLKAIALSQKQNLGVDIVSLEAHFLAGGSPLLCMQALDYANNKGVKTDFLQLSAIDLAQKDMFKAMNQSLEIHKIEFIQANLNTSQLGSFNIHYYGEFKIELFKIAFAGPNKEKIIEEIKSKTINFLENLEVTKLENLKELINYQILNEEFWNAKGLKVLSQNIKVN